MYIHYLRNLLLAAFSLTVALLSAQSYTIQGTIHNAADDKAIPGVKVETLDRSQGAESGPDGTFSLQLPVAQNVTLTFTADGFETITLDVPVGEEISINIGVVLLPVRDDAGLLNTFRQ